MKDYKTEVGVQMIISWSKLTQIDNRGRISLYMLLARRILIGVLKIRVIFWAAVALTRGIVLHTEASSLTLVTTFSMHKRRASDAI
jgi:hypothetical protein